MANFAAQGAIMSFDTINTQAKKAPNYKVVRTGGTLAYSLLTGFTPLNLVAIPFQIVSMIILIIVFMFVFDFGFLPSVFAAYIITGIIITAIAYVTINFIIDVVSPGNDVQSVQTVQTVEQMQQTQPNYAPNNINNALTAAGQFVPKNNTRINTAISVARTLNQ